MKKKKNTPPQAESSGKKAKKTRPDNSKPATTGSGLSRYLITALAISLIAIGAGSFALGWLQFERHQAQAEERVSASLASQNAALLTAVIQQAEDAARNIAAYPETSAALLEPTGLVARTLQAAHADLTIHFIARGQGALPESLSFTARELINKAQSESDKTHSALTPGNNNAPAQLFAASQSRAQGTVLIQQDLKNFQALLARLTPDQAHLEISQSSGRPLFALGQPNDGIVASRNVTAGWVAKASLPRGSMDSSLFSLFAIICSGIAALVALAIVFSFSAAGRGLKKDAALLTHLSEDLAGHAQATPRGKFSFPVLEQVTSGLFKLAAKKGGVGAPATRTAADAADGLGFAVTEEDQATLIGDDEQIKRLLPESVFREYDIRGIVGETITEESFEWIGRAIGTEALEAGQTSIIVGRDGRNHSPQMAAALIRGITASGRDVIDIGPVPTPLTYYGGKVLDTQSSVSVTGSHNPSSHNGLKIVINGTSLSGERIRALRERILRGNLSSGSGKVFQQDISDRYIKEIVDDIVLARPMKVVLDCGNGIAGPTVTRLFKQLGCDVLPLFADVDGNFPNHHPDTSKPENYRQLIQAVQDSKADLGIAFDGDGDRLGVVTPKGEIIWADRLMMLYARDLLSRSPGADIIFDIKCSRELARTISQLGGRPLMWKTGHSLIKAKLKETGAPLAGEMSGHIFFADRWHGFDDGAYSAARLLEILSLETGDADDVFSHLKTGLVTPEINIPSTDHGKFGVIEKLQALAADFGGTPSTIDGLRVDFEDGWGLVRASNTTAVLVARFEGRDQAALERITQLFKQQLQAVDPSLKLPF